MPSIGPYALALLAAVVHAGWNLVVARAGARDGGGAIAAPLVVSVLVLLPLVAITGWRADPAAVPWAAASAAVELIYFRALIRQYAALPVERSYPISRGSAPVIVLLISLALGHSPHAVSAIGVLALASGVVLTAGSRSELGRVLSFTLPVSAGIAIYTLLDARGVRHADPVSYLVLSMTPVAAAVLAGSLRRSGAARTLAGFRSPWVWAAGVGISGAYLLVLAALSRAQPSEVAVVAGLREVSVVLVPLFAWVLGRRRPGPAVLVGSVLILIGLLLINAGRPARAAATGEPLATSTTLATARQATSEGGRCDVRSVPFLLRGLRCRDTEHRTVGQVQQFVRRGAQDRPAQRALTPGTDHDARRVVPVGDLQQRLGRLLRDQLDHGGNPPSRRGLDRAGDGRAAELLQRHPMLAELLAPRAGRHGRVHEHQRLGEPRRDVEGDLQRVPCPGGLVVTQHDAHACSLSRTLGDSCQYRPSRSLQTNITTTPARAIPIPITNGGPSPNQDCPV